MFKKTINKIRNALVHERKRLLFLAAFIIGAIFIILMLLSPEASEVTKPPVISTTEQLEVISVEPTGRTESLNKLYSLAIRFNHSLEASPEDIIVDILPNVKLKKYTVTSQPGVLWVAPENTGSDPGWKDDVTYTVTIKKGSKVKTGVILENDYSFSFVNSTKELTDCGDWCPD